MHDNELFYITLHILRFLINTSKQVHLANIVSKNWLSMPGLIHFSINIIHQSHVLYVPFILSFRNAKYHLILSRLNIESDTV